MSTIRDSTHRSQEGLPKKPLRRQDKKIIAIAVVVILVVVAAAAGGVVYVKYHRHLHVATVSPYEVRALTNANLGHGFYNYSAMAYLNLNVTAINKSEEYFNLTLNASYLSTFPPNYSKGVALIAVASFELLNQSVAEQVYIHWFQLIASSTENFSSIMAKNWTLKNGTDQGFNYFAGIDTTRDTAIGFPVIGYYEFSVGYEGSYLFFIIDRYIPLSNGMTLVQDEINTMLFTAL